MEDDKLREDILRELRFIRNSINAGLLALITVSLHSGRSGHPSGDEWRKAIRLFDEAAKQAGLEHPDSGSKAH